VGLAQQNTDRRATLRQVFPLLLKGTFLFPEREQSSIAPALNVNLPVVEALRENTLTVPALAAGAYC